LKPQANRHAGIRRTLRRRDTGRATYWPELITDLLLTATLVKSDLQLLGQPD